MDMKRIGWVLCFAAFWMLTVQAKAIDFEVHGDMNHRFLIYTNHNDWFSPEQQGELNDGSVEDEYGELKYRFWFEAADDEGKVKGVYAVEIGGVRFGRTGLGRSEGGSFSGDAANVETRWAYLDFQLPFIDAESRVRVGLQPFSANSFLWQETAAGVTWGGDFNDLVKYQLGWVRVVDDLARDDDGDDIKDFDNFIARVNFEPMDKLTVGVFGLYSMADSDEDPPFAGVTPRNYLIKQFADNVDIDLFNLGVDGTFETGSFFFNWDLIYQTGTMEDIALDDTEFSGGGNTDGDFDVSAYLVHADVGMNLGKAKLTYTFWYASGDDDAGDDDFEGFISYDVDRSDNMSLFEGNYADDVSYFTERPYLLDKGMIMNKIGLEYQATEKLLLGTAAMYMMTAEDIDYTDFNGNSRSNDEIGIEFNAFAKYMLYSNVELAIGAGYLISGDALDAFEVDDLRDGDADENIFVSSARIRYMF
jgi:hypothetical protein